MLSPSTEGNRELRQQGWEAESIYGAPKKNFQRTVSLKVVEKGESGKRSRGHPQVCFLNVCNGSAIHPN